MSNDHGGLLGLLGSKYEAEQLELELYQHDAKGILAGISVLAIHGN